VGRDCHAFKACTTSFDRLPPPFMDAFELPQRDLSGGGLRVRNSATMRL